MKLIDAMGIVLELAKQNVLDDTDLDEARCAHCDAEAVEVETTDDIRERLEYLRGQLDAERISLDELHELQCLKVHINPDDVQLLEAAGVQEFQPERCITKMYRKDI